MESLSTRLEEEMAEEFPPVRRRFWRHVGTWMAAAAALALTTVAWVWWRAHHCSFRRGARRGSVGLDAIRSNVTGLAICYGFKVGQGVNQPRNNVRFVSNVVFDCSVGIGIDAKWGAAREEHPLRVDQPRPGAPDRRQSPRVVPRRCKTPTASAAARSPACISEHYRARSR